MAKEFCVTIDVIMSGDIYVTAESEREASQKVKQKYFVASDLRNFHQIDINTVECKEM